MKIRRNLILVATLSVLLALSPLLTGCGSLTKIVTQPDPPRENTAARELTHLLRMGEEYKGIEILRGTVSDPIKSPDGKGYIYEERGWIYLHIEGEAKQRGYQHGWLLADYIQRQIDHNASMIAENQALDWRYLKDNAERMWEDKVSEEYQAELTGIVLGAAERGATFDYLDLLVMNGLEELLDNWFPTVQADYFEEVAAGLWNSDGITLAVPSQSEEDELSDDEQKEEGTERPQSGEASTERPQSGEASTEGQQTGEASTDSAKPDQNEAADTQDNEDTEADLKDDSAEPEDKDDAEEDDRIRLLPFVNIEGITELPEDIVIKEIPQPANAYTRQAVSLLATGSITEDGNIVLAHNSIAAYANSNFSNVMVDISPADGGRFTMQTSPGLIHSVSGVYSGNNLVIASSRINGFKVYSEEGTPEFLRARQAAQYATSLDSFTAMMLEGNNGGLAATWLVGDLETNQIMELELGLSFYNIQKLLNGAFINFGGVDDARILNSETDGSGVSDIRQGDAARFVRLSAMCKTFSGKIDAGNAQTIIADHIDVYTNGINASSRGICAHYDLDDAAFATQPGVVPNMPFGTVDATVMTSDMAKDNMIIARWGSACGREFNSTVFMEKNLQFSALQNFIYDRPSEFWCKLLPADK